MSWFSLIQAERTVLESQEFFNDVITGELFGKYAVDNILKNKQIYFRIRSAVSSFFANQLYCPVERFSSEISEMLLKRAMILESLPKIFPELFNRFHDIAHESLLKGIPFSSVDDQLPETIKGLQDLVHKIFDEYLAKHPHAYKLWVQAIKNGDEDLEKFIKNAMVASLLPVCKKAVTIAFKTFIKTGVESVIDNSWKTGISIISIAAIYSFSMKIFDFIGDISDDSTLNHTFAFMQNRLPSPPMALLALTAVHTSEMIKIFWKTKHLKLKGTDLNKQEIENLAIKIARNPVKQALSETEVFKALTLTFNTEKINTFVDLFIREALDYYWKDLNKIKFLNIPLVT